MLILIEHMETQIKQMTKEIPLPEELEPQVELLRSMPGVGQLVSATIIAEIGDIRRFNFAKALCNWAGLTPRVHRSDRLVRHGRISKQGSRYLRTAMVCAATTACRMSPRWSRIYQRVAQRSGASLTHGGVLHAQA